MICVCLSPAPASDDVLSAPARSECLCAILISMVSGEEREGGTERESERRRERGWELIVEKGEIVREG